METLNLKWKGSLMTENYVYQNFCFNTPRMANGPKNTTTAESRPGKPGSQTPFCPSDTHSLKHPILEPSLYHLSTYKMTISQNGIIVLVIIGAVCLTLIVGSIWAMFSEHDEVVFERPSNEQLAYMRELRWRNLVMMEAEARSAPRKMRPYVDPDPVETESQSTV
ncbi:hypothetical protein DTO166G4_496 [Paecilomyces variotii]|nr:hypothetical protein DTO166G4_496 [Paecilomyces variotii]KAJ9230917.1 hypothetical protein DTO166G5_7066 [Paecilomyces variotii]